MTALTTSRLTIAEVAVSPSPRSPVSESATVAPRVVATSVRIQNRSETRGTLLWRVRVHGWALLSEAMLVTRGT